MAPSAGERLAVLERKIDELERLIHGAIEDPESLPIGRKAAREHEDVARRLRALERQVHDLVLWASGSTRR